VLAALVDALEDRTCGCPGGALYFCGR